MPAKQKRATKPAAGRKTRKGQLPWKPILVLLLIIITAVLIYRFWPNITNWITTTWENITNSVINTWDNLLSLLGAGLALIAAAVVTLICIIWWRLSLLHPRYWRHWLGAISLAFAVWGLLSFFTPGNGIVSQATLGGKFGKSIITASPITGGLRLAGLVFLGILFLAPRWTWQAIETIFKAIGKGVQNGWQALGKAWQNRAKVSHKPTAREIEFEKVETTEEATVTTGPTTAEITGIAPPEKLKLEKHTPALVAGDWQLPPISILDKPTETELSQADIEKRAQLIEDALTSYGVEAKVVQINVGPTVTQFGVEPGWDRKYKEVKERDRDGNVKVRLQEVSKTRVKVDRISSLGNDLALALAAPSIRVEAPVPGKSIVGIEVPNTSFGLVNLRGVIETAAFQKTSAKSKLALTLGKGAGGETVATDLAKMPHLLIAGATGSGKTVCLNSTICCLLMNNTPDDVQFIMIDPKRVELVTFNSIPHLIAPVVVETDKAVMSLRWLNQEMDNRYKKFAQVGARNIEGYNKGKQPKESMPYIVLFIDELADLMMAAFDEVEHTLCRLAQLARATGIHLIVATQRPSVDVITGLIKANFPTRISFALTSQVDSRTILDSTGAEKLLGRGDMLYMPTDASKPKRLQGCFVSDAETERLVYFWGSQQRPEMVPVKFEEAGQAATAQEAEDTLLDAARQLAQEHKEISTSFLQRRLRIGYPRAARLMEKLEEEGYKRGGIE